MFDEIIVKEDDDTRGRPRGDAAKWIVHGLEEVTIAASYHTILDETEAINTALDTAVENSLVVILPESVSRAISLIKARHPLPSTNLVGQEGGNGSTPGPEVDQYVEVHP
jgi:cyanophycin synthetase